MTSLKQSILFIFLFTCAQTSTEIAQNDICKDREGCFCVGTVSGATAIAECKIGNQCVMKQGSGLMCQKPVFMEYSLNDGKSQCEEIGCAKTDTCRVLDGSWFCASGDSSISDYLKVTSGVICIGKAGCICTPNQQNSATWFVITEGEKCAASAPAAPKSTLCKNNACYCQSVKKECTKDQYCLDGNIKGCSYHPTPGNGKLQDSFCDSGEGCFCGDSTRSDGTVFRKVFCGLGQKCNKAESKPPADPNSNTVSKPIVTYTCNTDFYNNEIHCDEEKGCYFSRGLSCRNGQYYRSRTRQCSDKQLKQLKKNDICDTSEGCLCSLVRQSVGDGTEVARLMIQKHQACLFQAASTSYIQTPPEKSWLCEFDACPCSDMICSYGQTCFVTTNVWRCVSSPTVQIAMKLM